MIDSYDLLSKTKKKVKISDDEKENVIKGLTVTEVRSLKEKWDCFSQEMKKRHTGATTLNLKSSKSSPQTAFRNTLAGLATSNASK